MPTSFLNFITTKSLFKKKDKVLLAVSGGIDSMVMVALFHHAGFNFGIAHCNFQLRGADAEEDEALVAARAQELGVPFHKIRFDTENAAKFYKSSIQLVARDLRYQWLEDIRATHAYHAIATAHHLNDSLETVLYNLSKGCGIRGLHGIPAKNGYIIRPLLGMTRTTIEEYAKKHTISFREDATNKTIKYNRNLIRHTVIPQLEKINPALLNTFARTLQQLQDSEVLFQEAIEQYKQKAVIFKAPYIHIDLSTIEIHPAKTTILFELVSPFGFNTTHIEQLLAEQTQVGAICASEKYELLKAGKEWIIRLKKSKKENFELVKKNTRKVLSKNAVFSFELSNTFPPAFPPSKKIAYLDAQLLSYPLTIRRWQAGDRFQPIGMRGKHKKVQDLLSDLKLHRFEKEEVLVLESQGKIAWVIGYRLDERFKLTANTQQFLEITYSKKNHDDFTNHHDFKI